MNNYQYVGCIASSVDRPSDITVSVSVNVKNILYIQLYQAETWRNDSVKPDAGCVRIEKSVRVGLRNKEIT